MTRLESVVREVASQRLSYSGAAGAGVDWAGKGSPLSDQIGYPFSIMGQKADRLVLMRPSRPGGHLLIKKAKVIFVTRFTL